MNGTIPPVAREEFTLGICATGEQPDVVGLARSLLAETNATPGMLRKLVIVASACPGPVVSGLRSLQRDDSRVDLLVEDARRGKSEAIDKILARTHTPIVVFANSDSRPEPGAIGKLLAAASSDQSAGAVSAIPVPEENRGLVSLLVGLMWSAHNRCSTSLNHMNLSNHSCDELVLFRSSAIARLPQNLVNDGAFLAGTARLKGYTVKVCPSARVHIETPGRVSEVVLQRRRILFGHAQVWRKIGTPPRTIESLLFLSPITGIRLLVATLAERPRFLAVLPVALVSEVSAALLSILDTLRSSTAHVVWRRFT